MSSIEKGPHSTTENHWGELDEEKMNSYLKLFANPDDPTRKVFGLIIPEELSSSLPPSGNSQIETKPEVDKILYIIGPNDEAKLL